MHITGALSEVGLTTRDDGEIVTVYLDGGSWELRLELDELTNEWIINLVDPQIDDEGVYLSTMLSGPNETAPEVEVEPRVLAQFVKRVVALIDRSPF
jgi:hypothetical protein